MLARYIRFTFLFALYFVFSGLALTAQDNSPHFGVMGNMAFPTGEFGGSESSRDSYYDYGRSRVPGFGSAFGGSIFVTLPVTDHVTVRPIGSYFRFRGDQADGWGYHATQMTLEISSYGCDLLFMLGGPYQRSRGYLFIGAASDSEKLAIGGEAYTTSSPDQYSVKRSALNFGCGRIMRRQNVGVVMELGYHRTLSGDMPAGLQMPGSDYWRISIGAIF